MAQRHVIAAYTSNVWERVLCCITLTLNKPGLVGAVLQTALSFTLLRMIFLKHFFIAGLVKQIMGFYSLSLENL